MRRMLWWFSGIAAVGLATVGIIHWARPRVHVGGPGSDAPRVALGEFDHAAYDRLLQEYVNDRGLVAYARWKANAGDLQALDDYLARIGAVNLGQTASRDAQLAYWINAYNALTLKGILREYPTSSIRNHTSLVGGYNLWTDLLLWIDGKQYSLDDMEHKVLRKMGEPRIHFALVCAAKGCPPLWNRAWTTANVDTQLTANARRFFAQPANFEADASSRTVALSQLFEWYGTDFAATPAEQLRVLRLYFPSAERLSWIEEADVVVRYLDYDWGLNDQRPP